MEAFTPSVPDDTIEYTIWEFPVKDKAGSATPAALGKTLQSVRNAANEFVDKHLKGYIWQREPFKLSLARGSSSSKTEVERLPHLHGQTNFGDSVEDEWLIVWLLRTLSQQFPSIWIRTTDNMGEFLLVEAANVLPGWLDPDVAENRVWINGGSLRLIPVSARKSGTDKSQSSEPNSLSLDDARQHIFEGRPTLHPNLVESEAFHRLKAYPAQISNNQHNSLILVPRKLAYVLHEEPATITAAVDAFYLRDAVTLKPLATSSVDSLVFPPKDFVTMRVRFTRVSYAQAKSQRFEQPNAWQDTESWHEDARHQERAALGMKVCAGYEMLLADPQRQDDRVVRGILSVLEDLQDGEAGLPTDSEIQSWGIEEDDDKWMDIDFRDFDEELRGRQGQNQASGTKNNSGGGIGARGGFGNKLAQENLRKMVQRFEDFLNDDSQDAYDIDNDDDGSDDDDHSDDDDEVADIDEDLAAGDTGPPFTEDDFTKMMREMMGMPEEVMRELMTGNMETESENEAEIIAREGLSSGEKVSTTAATPKTTKAKGKNHDDDEAEDSDEELRQLTALMEAELRSSGALNISSGPLGGITSASNGPGGSNPGAGAAVAKRQASAKSAGKGKSVAMAADGEGKVDDDDDDEPELLDADYNLVANMLQSFREQGGAAGPGGNLMGMLGLKLPRDDEDDDDDDEHGDEDNDDEGGDNNSK